MSKINDEIVEARIGIYDVLFVCDYKTKDGHKLYHVRCKECGKEFDMKKNDIRRAKECYHIDAGGNYINYNMKWENKRIKMIFKGMKSRCYNPNDESYKWYGAKGVKVCDEWINNPKSFEKWALLNGYQDNLTIDRKNEDKDYCPENCRWVSLENNSKYKSTTLLINVDGEIHTGKDWAKQLNLGINLINTYVRKYGEENTKEFIRRYLKSPERKPKITQNYYNLYMEKTFEENM